MEQSREDQKPKDGLKKKSKEWMIPMRLATVPVFPATPHPSSSGLRLRHVLASCTTYRTPIRRRVSGGRWRRPRRCRKHANLKDVDERAAGVDAEEAAVVLLAAVDVLVRGAGLVQGRGANTETKKTADCFCWSTKPQQERRREWVAELTGVLRNDRAARRVPPAARCDGVVAGADVGAGAGAGDGDGDGEGLRLRLRQRHGDDKRGLRLGLRLGVVGHEAVALAPVGVGISIALGVVVGLRLRRRIALGELLRAVVEEEAGQMVGHHVRLGLVPVGDVVVVQVGVGVKRGRRSDVVGVDGDRAGEGGQGQSGQEGGGGLGGKHFDGWLGGRFGGLQRAFVRMRR